MIKRLLIVGSGSAGIRHLKVARALMPRADIRIFCRKAPMKNFSLANGSFQQICEALSFAPEAVVVANPAPFHLKILDLLAPAKCHFLVEKPLAHHCRGTKNLIRKMAVRNLILQVGYNLRFLPSLRKFKKLIKEGSIGKILSVHAEVGQYLPCWRPNKDYRKTVSAQAKLGGGVLLELSHEFDYLRWIFGEVNWVSAQYTKVSNLFVDVEDSATITLGFKKGIMAKNAVATVSMDFFRQDPVRICHAVGSKGSLRWNGLTGKIEIYLPEKKKWDTVLRIYKSCENSFVNQTKSFILCIKKRQIPEITGLDGLKVLKIIEAARLSNKKKGIRIHVSNIKA